jgi:hypothetical protein
MGIQSTMYISRETAIDRILKIVKLKKEKNYRELEEVTSDDYSVAHFVDKEEDLLVDKETLTRWTDTMLTDQMDQAFYRFSLFDNYLIGKEE